MWDVKSLYKMQRSNLIDGFIWTMWDVKFIFVVQHHLAVTAFYMNYVGCKAYCE